MCDQSAVVVSFGNELRGDDSAGILFGRLIEESRQCRVIEGGTAPENITGVVADACPDMILIADTADFGGEPGTCRLLDPFRLSFDCASTHGTTALWCEYVKALTGAHIHMIGFQPVSLAFGAALTSVVEHSVREAAGRCTALGVERFIAFLQEGVAHETALDRAGGR